MILEPVNAQDALRPLRQQNLVDAANDSLNTSAAGRAQTVPTGRGRGIIVQDQPTLNVLVRVRIDAAAAGGGKYRGWVLDEPDILVRNASDLAEIDVGKTPTYPSDTLILNMHEIGKATHDLTSGTPVVKTFLGELVGVNRDGDAVVVINGLDVKDCGTSPPGAEFAPAEDPSVYHTAAGASGTTTVVSR